jgi:hypothetical protein
MLILSWTGGTRRPTRCRAGHPTIQVAAVVAACLFVLPQPGLLAQGVATAAISGTIRATDGVVIDRAAVTVANTATGATVTSEARHGRFLIHGLPVGGPYIVTVRHEGFRPSQLSGVTLNLGSWLELQIELEPLPMPLAPLRVAAASPLDNPHGGTAVSVQDSLVHRLPTLNRDLYDFVRLAPHVTTRIGFAAGGMSGGGVGFRFNNFLIDGLPERSIPGNQPPEFAGSKSLPFEAVREFQILTAPFDVRYGDFAGALVNTVTRSGTNRFRGSVFAQVRNDGLARRGGVAAADPYERLQYGISLGGPLRKDRLHFFLASELQGHTSPAAGPFVGQPMGAVPPVPVAESQLARLEEIMTGHGLVAGSGGAVTNRNPLWNVFARMDLAVPERSSRLVFWVNSAASRNLRFARPDRSPFPLSTQSATQLFDGRTLAVQVHTALPRMGGGHNELSISHRSLRSEWLPEVRQPIVRVTVPGTSGGAVTVVSGTARQAHGGSFRSWDVNLRDNLTVSVGTSHVATLGVEAAWFRTRSGGLANGYGTWTFSSLDSLEAGFAHSYELARDFGSANIPLSGAHYAVYAGDRWRPGKRVTITMGIRAEALALYGATPYNAEVDSVFGRRTDDTEGRPIHLSPRVGFVWDMSAAGRDRIRGGAGIFTGRPPLAWLHAARTGYGFGGGILRCGPATTDLGPAPAFIPDYQAPPTACADGSGVTTPPRGDVNLIAPRLRMAQTLRGVLAYDRRLGENLNASIEVAATRITSDFIFANVNLEGPRAVDRHGRTLYGRIDPAGIAHPAERSDSFPSVIELRNTSSGRSYQASARVERRFAEGAGVLASYTYSRVRDVQTPLRINVDGHVNWSSRAVSGRHDDLSPGISLNDIPHRLVIAGTYRAPWRSTELAIFYVGESGSPFTYIAGGAGGRGDLNADGSAVNDPIYVPRDAFDAQEILISGASAAPGDDNSPEAQAERELLRRTAFEQLIRDTPCLRRQRGHILRRNSCREPWSHTTIASVRQRVPFAGGGIEAEVVIFNLLNLVHSGWGHRRVAVPQLLEHVGQTPEPTGESLPIFRLDAQTAAQWLVLPTESFFQLQLGLRYRF